MRDSLMPLNFADPMTALHWVADMQEFRFRNKADPLAELLQLAEALDEIAARVSVPSPEMPAPMDDPLGFLGAARAYLSQVALDPNLSAAPAGETIH